MLVSPSFSAGAAGRGERSVCWSVVHPLLVLLAEGRGQYVGQSFTLC